MKQRTFVVVIGALVATIIIAGVLVGIAMHLKNSASQSTIPRPSGVPANLSNATVNLMELSPLPHRAAPDFTLTDQFGHQLSLHSFRGKNVVLNFMDPHCTDICPIVSQELIDANHLLGARSADTVFLAVNVNPYYRTRADVAAFSNEHHLSSLRSWHFLTGSLTQLHAVWSSYGIAVSAPSPTKDIQHTSVIYFINARGEESYLAAPVVDHTKKGVAYLPSVDLHAWASGIARVVEDLK